MVGAGIHFVAVHEVRIDRRGHLAVRVLGQQALCARLKAQLDLIALHQVFHRDLVGHAARARAAQLVSGQRQPVAVKVLLHIIAGAHPGRALPRAAHVQRAEVARQHPVALHQPEGERRDVVDLGRGDGDHAQILQAAAGRFKLQAAAVVIAVLAVQEPFQRQRLPLGRAGEAGAVDVRLHLLAAADGAAGRRVIGDEVLRVQIG